MQEKESVKRFLRQEIVDATFTRAVLRFTDDTFSKFATQPSGSLAPPANAQSLATKLNEELLRETGLNLSARLLSAIQNQDTPGVFYGEFDGGNRDRFGFMLDPQARVLNSVFEINGAEKGLLFQYNPRSGFDIWTAFYGQADLQRGTAYYPDAFDLVSIPVYRMDIDLRDPGDWLRAQMKIQIVAEADNVRVIPMQVNEALGEANNERRDKAVRVIGAELADGTPIRVIQEEWETGVSLVLPAALARGARAELTLKLEGKDSLWSFGTSFHYPRSTTTWYPRYGYLARSRFELVFRHKKTDRIASVGQRLREGPVDGNSEEWVTEWAAKEPVAFVTFVCGAFERHNDKADIAGQTIPLEYYSPPGSMQRVKEDFILAEMSNAVRYFSEMFGRYPYGRLGGAFFPTRYGQGFPTLLLLPVQGTAVNQEFAFLAHENAHQWWGNIVAWRSYRDQWLSEGFAEYSGVLYTGTRKKPSDAAELIKEMRQSLLELAITDTGVSKQKVHEIGPIILGHRLQSRLSVGGGELIYSKGGLVLRMLHFLLTNPDTGDGVAFFDMMKDFVEKHRNGKATTESFMQVASEHFARSPLGRRYGLKDLNWFLGQWVYQTGLPSYRLDYSLETRQGGGVTLKGTLLQEGVPKEWFMPIPVVFDLSGNRRGRVTIHALGPQTPVEIPLPEKPQRVRLDPDLWVLSEETSEKSN
jgi:hypothetical protein